MKYDLTVRDHNRQPHIDIESDMQARKNGILTFSIRINDGDIVDYAPIEYIDAKTKYLALRSITIQEFSVPHDLGKRGTRDTFRGDNLQRTTS